MRFGKVLVQSAVWIALAGTSAFAQLTTISSPTSSYTGATTLFTIAVPDGTAVPSLTAGGETVTFTASPTLTAHTVPNGGWATWNSPPLTESATPRVLTNYSSTTVTLTFSAPIGVFGCEVEPDPFSAHTITATYMNGISTIGSVSRSVNGSAGALLAAASSAQPITSVVITSDVDFAMAQLRFAGVGVNFSGGAAVPALSFPMLVILCVLLLGTGAVMAMSRKNSART